MRSLLVVLLVALAGCAGTPGSDDPSDDSAPDGTGTPPVDDDMNGTVELTAVQLDFALSGAYPVNIDYDPASAQVSANSVVTVVFTNNDVNPVPGHNWVLEGVDGAATAVIDNGDTTEVTFAAPPPGTYQFYCSVGNHRDVGMEGTFTVTA